MNSLLESAGDSLSDTEKEIYNSLTTNKEKTNYLRSLLGTTAEDLAAKRAKQKANFNALYSRSSYFGINA